MSLERNLRAMERTCETYWRRFAATAPMKLRWRALTVRHCFHVLPGESILELGAGSGLWTAHLAEVLRGENPITAAVLNEDFARQAAARQLPNTRIVHVNDLRELPSESFDYIVGTGILSHELSAETLAVLYRVLKPGGQLLCFEANYWNPLVLARTAFRRIAPWRGKRPPQIGMRKVPLMTQASHHGFTRTEVVPYDIIPPRTPRSLIPAVESVAFILEQAPVIREMCRTLYVWLVKPGAARRPHVNLATHPQFFGATSIVVPCHNEEMNVRPLITALTDAYDAYIHEIIIVDDNSSDGTANAVRAAMQADARVRLIQRRPPNGVGRALRDGYAAATGRYILTIDGDFVLLVPELRDLFDCIAQGRDGAIGSRFSYESVMINYPFFKSLCNRAYHLLVNLTLLPHVRDLSNNLKLYRADILKTLDIEEPHFAANVETGLKPLLAGYDVGEVPISWVGRTAGMGSSSFGLVRVAPGYVQALMRIIRRVWRGQRDFSKPMAKIGAGPESVDAAH